MKGDSLAIDLGRDGVAELDANSNAALDKLQKQLGKALRLHGVLHEHWRKIDNEPTLIFSVD